MPKLYRPVRMPSEPETRYWHSCKLQKLNATRFEQTVNGILTGRFRLVTPKRETSGAR